MSFILKGVIMSEKQEDNDNNGNIHDLKAYLSEIQSLESDFSDLDDLDMEEIQEMQDAINKVIKIGNEGILDENDTKFKEDIELKEAMLTDFSDLDEIDFDELKEMKEAIDEVKVKEEEKTRTSDTEGGTQPKQEISKDLEDRIKQELLIRKKIEEKERITPESFLNYIRIKRDKIWYHVLYYLTFEVEDHVASKMLLHEVLKEKTSKSAIDPIPEHKFYFGLGYILRLHLNDKQVVRYLSGGKFKINVNIGVLKKILNEAGEPISTRPIIEEDEKKKMFSDFLKDDFSDI